MKYQLMGKKIGFRLAERIRTKMGNATILVLLFAGLFEVVVLCGITGCHWGSTDLLPEDIFGVWITSNPDYQDRFFEITKVTIVFGTGPESADAYIISKVKKDTDTSAGDQFIIIYEDTAGNEYELSFLFHPETKSIQFLHQENLRWQKLTKDVRQELPENSQPDQQ